MDMLVPRQGISLTPSSVMSSQLSYATELPKSHRQCNLPTRSECARKRPKNHCAVKTRPAGVVEQTVRWWLEFYMIIRDLFRRFYQGG